jgi:dipeptidyl aminopeptidase/acylaminoacyl peptidase
VPYQQSVKLKKQLDEAGGKNEFMTIVGGLHSFTSEQNTDVTTAIFKFLKALNIVSQ